MRFFTSLLFVVVASGSSVVACASSSSSSNPPPGCAADPFSCGAGTTCSAKDASGTFACLPSGGGAKFSACQNTLGVTMCGDGLVCLQQSAAGGQCSSYCEKGSTPGSSPHSCAVGETCRAAALVGTQNVFYLCTGGTAPVDAGGGDAAHD